MTTRGTCYFFSLRQALKRLLELQPFRWAGFLAIGFAISAIWFGYRHQDYVFTVLGLGLAALWSASLLSVIALAVLTWRAVRSESSTVRGDAVTGVRVLSAFHLPRSWLPLVRRSWSWMVPQGVTVDDEFIDGEQWERLRFGSRGLHDRLVRRLVCEDIFGFCRIAFRCAGQADLRIEPETAAPFSSDTNLQMNRDETWAHPSGRPTGDWIEMRRYVPGDPLKRVLWKAFARTRTLMVRTPEAAVGPVQKWFIYLVAGEQDDVVAALLSSSLRAGVWGQEWSFGADGSPGVTQDVEEAVRRICLSGGARSQGGTGLSDFFEQATAAGALCLLFLPARRGIWFDQLTAALAEHANISVRLVFALAPELGRKAVLARRLLFTAEEKSDLVSEAEWNDLVDQLAQRASSRHEIVVVNSHSGVARVLEPTRLVRRVS